MRYSARTRNIEWAENGPIKEATDFITEFLASDSPYIFKYRLQQNEGVISNNVLHNRTAFKNDEQHNRLLYRARFYERVNIS
jgi:alpha-ketoglutarate-dependent taurine dioxygenase